MTTGVETVAQLGVLRWLGSGSVQGYLTGAPARLIDPRGIIASRQIRLPAT